MISFKYKAFTLTEMLTVMGIVIILMVIGVATGMYAIDRSNEIEHKNGATKIYQAAQSYYTDNREFPEDGVSIETMVSPSGPLKDYLDMGTFNGGSEASYYYFTNDTNQAVLICVTLGGRDDVNQKGILCVGNGFGDSTMSSKVGTISQEKLYPVDASYDLIIAQPVEFKSDWDGKTWVQPVVTEDEIDPCFPCADLPKDAECLTGVPSYCDDLEEEEYVPIPKDIPVPKPIDPLDPCSPDCVPNPRLGIQCLDVESPACM